MIYQGTDVNVTGNGTQIQSSQFNTLYNDNAYVGYMYTLNQVHGLGSNSGIKTVLDTWYQNNLTGVADKIDGNAGFCGDREPSTSNTTSNGNGGTGTTYTYYGTYIRLITNKAPTFVCKNDSDLYTTSGSGNGNKALQYPIGLISADEVAYAGGGYLITNQNYYLYTGNTYWTISPSDFHGGAAYVFSVGLGGDISYPLSGHANSVSGVRPVINLKADVRLSGEGTVDSPYRVVES